MSEAMKSPEMKVEEGQAREKKSPVGRLIILAVLVLAAIFGTRYLIWSRSHEQTDNAQVSSDVVMVAAQINGTVTNILVNDNQEVHKGQLLVEIDPRRYSDVVNQAKASLEAAKADAKAAGVAVQLIEQTAKAAEVGASGGIEQADAGISASKSQVETARANEQSSKLSAAASAVNVQTAQTMLGSSQDAVTRAQAGVDAAQAQVNAAQAAVSSSQAGLKSSQSAHDLAAKNLARMRTLFEQDAISRQSIDEAEETEQTAAAAVSAAQAQLDSAKAGLSSRQADLRAQQAALLSAQQDVKQSELRITLAKRQYETSQSAVVVASSQVKAAQDAVKQSTGKKTQSLGQQIDANAGNIRVAQQEASWNQALSKVQLAQATLNSAEIDLQNTKVFAPCDGRVSKRLAELGGLAQNGGALLYVVPANSIYVVANFKETQMEGIKPGYKAEVEVDAIPGKTFKAEVDSIAGATGSTFALLPPDNATGNFVKVVQRVPVKIRFENPESLPESMRVGMSVTATVARP